MSWYDEEPRWRRVCAECDHEECFPVGSGEAVECPCPICNANAVLTDLCYNPRQSK